MKNIKRVILGLAAVTMLASCAKEITKEEAIKIAEGWDTANVLYKSGHGKSVTEVKFSDNFPEAMKETFQGGTQETDLINSDACKNLRLSAATLRAMPEDIKPTFKADGNKLEISYTQEQSQMGMTLKVTANAKTDENGYPTDSVSDMVYTIVAEATYTATVHATVTYTWVK